MNFAPAMLEERLLQGYREQLRCYDRAADILDGDGVSRINDPSGSVRWAQALHDALQGADALARDMAKDVESWRQSGQVAGQELRSVLERLGQRIQGLSISIERCVEGLRAHQHQLLPQIDEFLHKRRMLHSYAQNT